MSPRDKPIVWLSGEIKTPPFGPKARLEAGFLLRWRIVYHVAADAVAILAVFQKRTQATPVQVIGDCQRRLSAFLAAMQQRRGKR